MCPAPIGRRPEANRSMRVGEGQCYVNGVSLRPPVSLSHLYSIPYAYGYPTVSEYQLVSVSSAFTLLTVSYAVFITASPSATLCIRH